MATLMGMRLSGRYTERVKGIEGEGLEKLFIHAAKINEAKITRSQFEYLLGKVYLQLILKTETSPPMTPSLVAKNLGFLIKNLPFAAKKAERHLNEAIALAREMGGNWILAQACLDLGFLHQAKKRREKARQCFSEAIALFEQSEADTFLHQAKEALASLEQGYA